LFYYLSKDLVHLDNRKTKFHTRMHEHRTHKHSQMYLKRAHTHLFYYFKISRFATHLVISDFSTFFHTIFDCL